jgi:hypothetical protein
LLEEQGLGTSFPEELAVHVGKGLREHDNSIALAYGTIALSADTGNGPKRQRYQCKSQLIDPCSCSDSVLATSVRYCSNSGNRRCGSLPNECILSPFCCVRPQDTACPVAQILTVPVTPSCNLFRKEDEISILHTSAPTSRVSLLYSSGHFAEAFDCTSSYLPLIPKKASLLPDGR